MDEIPREVVAAYSLEGAAFEPSHSLINRTFIASLGSAKLVLQRLHPVFGAEVHYDIQAITGQLARAGIETPRLIPTRNGDLWHSSEDGGIWRAQSFVEGRVIQAIETPEQAGSAAQLVARFHAALSESDYDFVHVRPNVHNTARYRDRLQKALQATELDEVAQRLGRELLEFAEGTRIEFGELPRRICHGDLKISNVLFVSQRPGEARCLIDLDTLGYQVIPHELGDALRSWCNPSGESHDEPRLDRDIFVAALRGYAAGAPGLLSEPEAQALVAGLETISLELSTRFCIDVFEDRYFGFDPLRFATRRDHNLARARGQLALARAVRRERAELEAVAARCLG